MWRDPTLASHSRRDTPCIELTVGGVEVSGIQECVAVRTENGKGNFNPPISLRNATYGPDLLVFSPTMRCIFAQ